MQVRNLLGYQARMRDGLLQRLCAAYVLHHPEAACNRQHRVSGDLQEGTNVSVRTLYEPKCAFTKKATHG